MKTSLYGRTAAVLVMILAFALGILAQDHKQDPGLWLGQWSMTSETDDEPVRWTLNIKGIEGKPDIYLSNKQGEQQVVKDASFVDGTLKFKAPYGDYEYDIELRMAGEKLSGTWNGNGNSGKTSGLKD